jgi:hypothetical protein
MQYSISKTLTTAVLLNGGKNYKLSSENHQDLTIFTLAHAMKKKKKDKDGIVSI